MELSAEELAMPALDFVRHVLGKPLTDEEAEYILWEKTAFPMASPAYIMDQLLELRENDNGI